ncbi:MAG: glycosyltransferase [Lachnospiraceae bacterium]
MKKLSIVILNYLNYKDTIECVESVFEMGYDLEGIVIVDNHSSNNSYAVLKKKYKDYRNILVIQTGRNYGFAKGNNIGIMIARKRFKTDFVFVVNNDTIFKQKNYFEELLDKYESGVGVIGSKIYLKDGHIQEKEGYDISVKGSLNNLLQMYLVKYGKDLWSFVLPQTRHANMADVLHGCALLFTPDFFEHYNGFYDKTFLYSEEPILYLMCKKYKLKQLYVDSAYIYHKEDQSSEMSFQNKSEVMISYQAQSYKYLVWWIIKDKISDKIRRSFS